MAEYNVYIDDKAVKTNLEESNLTCHYGINQLPKLTLRIKDIDIKNGMVADDKVKDGDKEQFFDMGSKIEIKTEIGDSKEALIFSGLITERAIFRDGGTFLEVIAHGDVIKLTEGPGNFLLDKEVNDYKIIEAMFKGAGLDPKGIAKAPLEPITQPHYFSYRQTPWRVVMNRVLANGLLLVPTPKGNYVAEVAKPELTPAPKEVAISQQSVEGFRLHQDIRSQLGEVKASVWDSAKQVLATEPKLGDGKAVSEVIKQQSDGLELKPNPLLIQDGLLAPEQENQARANAELIYRKLDRHRGRVTLLKSRLTTKVNLLDKLDLSDFGQAYSGKYPVTGITHHFNGQSWSVTFTLGLHLNHSLFSDWLTPPAVPHLMGQMGEMKALPDESHRVPVWLPGISSDPKQVVMARLLSPFASKEAGLYLPPNQGDEVVVAFAGGDCRYPVIVGASHNAINKAGASWQSNPGMYLKGLDNGKEVCSASLIFAPKEKTLTLSAQEKDQPQSVLQAGSAGLKVEAQDKGGKPLMALALSGEKLALTKDDNNAITLGENIDINSGGAVNIKVGKKMEVKK